MTQKNIADALHISDKTVSKWECGLGCPDLSLWPELSEILGVDVQKLLQGELIPNKPDSGNLKRIRFYVCSVCGNILTSTGKASISCCGKKLNVLDAAPSNQDHEIHVDYIDSEFYVSLKHEMTKSHYISFIAYAEGALVLIKRMYPEQDSAVRIPHVSRWGCVYAYCVQHGLFIFKDAKRM